MNWKNNHKLFYQGMEKTLDASSNKEQSFRLQLFTKNLPVLRNVEKWNSDKKVYTPNAICIRCEKEEETFEHIMRRPKQSKIDDMIEISKNDISCYFCPRRAPNSYTWRVSKSTL
jgi:redox-regulated HSP33 family molecular chaperone